MSFEIMERVRREPGGKHAVVVGPINHDRKRDGYYSTVPVFYLDHKGKPKQSEWLFRNLRSDPDNGELWAHFVAAQLLHNL